ncbi:hypothetical protein VNI00_007613 [Paramarasmius palmivorus]|uniref:DUF1793-domain-containing protein n=1 Tax=Paramarasmius palmivorus TaxID=297713 RepID=A0AAW0D4N3_9AGAR
MILFVFHTIILLTVTLTSAQFQPSVVPLLIRSPFLNSWVDRNTSSGWPMFWNTKMTLGLGGFVRVDGAAYEWMGNAFEDLNLAKGPGENDISFVEVHGIDITPTRTIYSVSAGLMQLNFTFLSPVEPQDLTLQSFPFAYIYVDAISRDGNPHNVQLYCDLSGEWLSEDGQDNITWTSVTSDSMIFHRAQLQTPDKPADDMVYDGQLYFATQDSSGNSWQTGEDRAQRSSFIKNGKLDNTEDHDLRCISCSKPVFAFSNDLGNITITSKSIVWAVGYVRNNVVRLNGSQELKPYWTTVYSRVEDGLQAFLADFSNANARAESLDDKIVSNAQKVSSVYADIVSLSTRQAFGGVEIAVSSSGSALMFMKDIDATQRISPVDRIFASLPAYLYINATWVRYLLEPLFQFPQSPLYTEQYAAPNLGSNYPDAQGAEPDLTRTIEGTWNSFHAQYEQYILIHGGRFGHVDADGSNDANLTNLALKGITGVRAMAEISHTLGQRDDADRYQGQAARWIQQWEASASTGRHLKSSYNSDSSSWSMIYNLFADKLLGMNLIYDEQDAFYNKLESGSEFGLTFNSSTSNNQIKYHWTLLIAATTKDPSTRAKLLQGVYEKAIDLNKRVPFPITYDIKQNRTYGKASPGQGAAFSILSMDLGPGKLAGSDGRDAVDSSSGRKPKAGAIAGGVIGSIGGIAIFIFGFLFCRRRKIQYDPQKETTLTRFFGRSRVNDRPDVEPMHWNPTQYHSPSTRKSRAEGGSEKVAGTGEIAARRNLSSSNILPTSLPLVSESNANFEVSALRNELEDLRRNMEEMRSRPNDGPPPSYRQ